MSEGFFNKNRKNRLKPFSTEENKNIQIDAEEGNINNNNNDDKKNEFNFSTSSNFYKNTIS